jgi:hypothetical protein
MLLSDGQDVSECQRRCAEMDWCQSVEFEERWRWCVLSSAHSGLPFLANVE